ncbi:hypothetical protein MOO45_02805 [Bombilactobacillus folatiphilus]|uniref:DUF1492 domain-containing protein n=1 Tax=Bombilactobacillus folatiphilus TaxID=2923362 RepID=A0ABY4PA34_9LACO|nr:hypothetical protein [Bombilactobacillus folatiphilus]UQS82595.1 hypothetical protein MOO45_02805 [Bombilactobacillus folatiphilus]
MSDELFKINKRFLNQYRIIMSKVDRLETKLARLDERKFALGNSKITGMPKGGIALSLEDTVAQIDATNRRINEHLQDARKLRGQLENIFDQLINSKQAEVLDMYFIERLGLYEISLETSYSYRYVTQLYTRGVKSCRINN